MSTTFNFKKLFDLPEWRPLTPSINAQAAGSSLAADNRPGIYSNPFIYALVNTTTFLRFSPISNEWMALASPALAGTFGAGAAAVFHGGQGPSGVLSAGNTTTKIVLSTALPAAVGLNQLANRGDTYGYRIRIIGNSAGGSGKVEERFIVANTGGMTPTIYLDSALSFTPAAGDAYEILSGRVYFLGAGALAAGIFKAFDVATNSFITLAQTNLPATIANDTALLSMSEGNTPYNRNPGEGFFGTLTATASSSTTITGQASGGDSGVETNRYRNFQIRVVQDTTTPTAVGQRRRVASHTAGVSAVYTLASAWTVTPSANAQFVIEYDNDKILCWTSNVATTYCYNIAANTWDTTTFGASGGVHAAGVMAFGSWGIVPNPVTFPSMIHVFRGGNVATLDILDISNGANGTWENAVVVGGVMPAVNTGTCGVYDGCTNEGHYAYINSVGTQRMLRYDVENRVVEPFAFLPVGQSTATVGNRMELLTFVDGASRMSAVNLWGATQTNFYQCWLHL